MFRLGDIIIYSVFIIFISLLGFKIYSFEEIAPSKIEVYVENKLYQVESLQKDKKEFFVPTELGGINVLLENNMVKVTSSNSPKKLIVKQGFISRAGESLIGVPDKVIIKIVGASDLDYIIK